MSHFIFLLKKFIINYILVFLDEVFVMASKNEKTKIRILPILLLVIVMLLSLCACDDESPGIETTTTPQNTETTESSTADTTEEMATDEFGNPVGLSELT